MGDDMKYPHFKIEQSSFTFDQLLILRNRRIKKWYNQKDVVSLNYSFTLMSAFSIGNVVRAGRHFSRRFYTPVKWSYFASFCISGFSTIGYYLSHKILVRDQIVSGRLDCAPCGEIRSAFLSLFFNVVVPVPCLLFWNLIVANSTNCYQLPHISLYKLSKSEYAKQVYKLVMRDVFNKSMIITLQKQSLVSLVFGMLMFSVQFYQFGKVVDKLQCNKLEMDLVSICPNLLNDK
ncbi:hypothetical protein GJ496_008258 [Pomphorhynchus laevis]|nr:hypothetical protein GJ496_008258 [Pomphorhynchus laevis]